MLLHSFDELGHFGIDYKLTISRSPDKDEYHLTFWAICSSKLNWRITVRNEFSQATSQKNVIKNILDQIKISKMRIRSLETYKSGQLEIIREVLQSIYPQR